MKNHLTWNIQATHHMVKHWQINENEMEVANQQTSKQDKYKQTNKQDKYKRTNKQTLTYFAELETVGLRKFSPHHKFQ